MRGEEKIISANNSVVNTGDVGGSIVNSVGGSDDVGSIFMELRQAIQNGVADEKTRTAIQNKADELEKAVGKPAFLDRYKEFMTVAANHISVIAPFLPHFTPLLHH